MSSNIDHDQIFKVLIRTFFKEFMDLFLPEESELIDFRRVVFLEKEIFTDFPGGRRKVMDLVVRVALKDGKEEYILIHTEFESRKPEDFTVFSERMYKYYCQLFLRYGKPVIPVVIFSDDRKWRQLPEPNYRIKVGGATYVDFTYHLIKLKNHNWREFLDRRNPLAYALMAKMDFDRQQRARLKMEFLRLVLKSSVNQARKGVLLNFIEKYVILDSREQEDYRRLTATEEKYREVEKMITVYEERGLEKGLLEKAREAIIDVLEIRFGQVPSQLKEKINCCDNLRKLKTLHRQAVLVESVDKLEI